MPEWEWLSWSPAYFHEGRVATPGRVCILCADLAEDSSPFSSIGWEVASLLGTAPARVREVWGSVSSGVLPQTAVDFPLTEQRSLPNTF